VGYFMDTRPCVMIINEVSKLECVIQRNLKNPRHTTGTAPKLIDPTSTIG